MLLFYNISIDLLHWLLLLIYLNMMLEKKITFKTLKQISFFHFITL